MGIPCNKNKSDKYEIYQIYLIKHEKYEINICEQNRDGTANKKLKSTT